MRRFALLITVFVAVIFAGGLMAPALALADRALCQSETARQESLMGIPKQLLHAISLVESGRWDTERRESFAWPWTVTAEGEGQYLPSKEAAKDEVRRLLANGVRNIDVGCMQVNLQAHPDAFATLDDAFDPKTNVAYAAHFLSDLFKDAGNWPTAGAYYHSQTPNLAKAYKDKLMSVWDQARRHGEMTAQFAAADDSVAHRPPVGLLLWEFSETKALDSGPPAGSKPMGANAPAVRAPQTQAEREEAKRAADAYRQSRIEEYRQRKASLSAGSKT